METEKEIRIRLRSERYEVEASLFSSADAEETGDGFFALENVTDTKGETIEVNTVGLYREADGRVEISYHETEATGMEGSVTKVSFAKQDPGIITMVRDGSVSTTLVFEEGKRYQCVYQTPYMPFTICVKTSKVENFLCGVGTLKLDYMIEIRGAKAERTKLYVQLLT